MICSSMRAALLADLAVSYNASVQEREFIAIE
jgi:hypothetical protein